MFNGRSWSRRLVTALAMLSMGLSLTALAAPALAKNAPGNNGTVKIHDGETDNEPIVNNEPHVCTFHLHFFFGDEVQSGKWWINSWPPTGDGTTVLSGSYEATAGEDIQPNSGVYSLPNGHYKLFWEGATNPGGKLNIKHKVFWTDCQDESGSQSASQSSSQPECVTLAGAALRDALKTAGSGVDNPQVATDSTATQWHATLVVPQGFCAVQVSFSSYDLPGGMIHPFDAQVLFDNVTDTYGPGSYDLYVDLPDCRWQVDLYTGDVIAHLNASYGHPADRLIDWSYNQGALCDEASNSQSASASPTRSPKETPEEDHASLNIKKVDGNGKPLAGAVFTVEGLEGTFTTGANGKACITGLPHDTEYLVTEIKAPTGYEIADPASQMVEVDDDGDCNSADAIFVNLPKESPSETPEQSVSESQSASASPSESESTPASHTPEESVKGGQGGPGGGDLPNTSTGGSAWTVGWGALLLASAMALFMTRRRGEVRAR